MDIEKLKEKLNCKIIYFKEIDSTNDYAKKNDFKETTLILADMQTKGRGQGNNIWYTMPGKNIIMTIVKMPNCKISKLEGLTMKIAEKIKDVMKEKYNVELQVKYPNDLLLNDKKICGILTETILQGEIVKKLIIGIGFNVNQEIMNEEIREMSTSLKIETGKSFELEKIIYEICLSIL